MTSVSNIDPTTLADWWRTEIVSIARGEIRMRGYPVEELIGRVGFCDMIWLMLRRDSLSPAQRTLLEAAT